MGDSGDMVTSAFIVMVFYKKVLSLPELELTESQREQSFNSEKGLS